MAIPHLVDSLKQSPEALLAIQAFQAYLQEEKQKREAFYNAVQEDDKAEFINGEVIFQSPVKRRHWRVGTRLTSRLEAFTTENNLGEVGAEKVMIQLTRNDYEPDIVFFSNEKVAGFTEDQMLFPAPDFVVEIISPSTEKMDREVKWSDYAAHGIPEYWIIDPVAQTIEQYTLPEDGTQYALSQKMANTGRLTATAVPGFSVELAELFA